MVIIIIVFFLFFLPPYERYLQLQTSKNHVPMTHSFAAILYLQFMVYVILFSM